MFEVVVIGDKDEGVEVFVGELVLEGEVLLLNPVVAAYFYCFVLIRFVLDDVVV